MKKMKYVYRIITALIVMITYATLFVSCKNKPEEEKVIIDNENVNSSEAYKPYSTEELVGVWIRNQNDVKDLLELRQDGTFELVGNEYWAGRKWQVKGDSLQLELRRLTGGNDDLSYVSYAVIQKNDRKIFNLRTKSEKNIANNNSPFVKGATNYPTSEWIGRWAGVERTRLDILPNGDFYDIRIYKLDAVIRVISEKVTTKPEIVFFTDDMKKHTIIQGDGVNTGMRWLANKENCLII